MKAFEFVLIIVSLIVGLALTEFAIGLADMIKIVDTAHYYWAHILWMLYGFVGCMSYWVTVYKLRNVEVWSIFRIGLVFTSGLLFFVMTRLVFPDRENFDHDYEKYFYAHIGIQLVILILYVICYGLESYV